MRMNIITLLTERGYIHARFRINTIRFCYVYTRFVHDTMHFDHVHAHFDIGTPNGKGGKLAHQHEFGEII